MFFKNMKWLKFCLNFSIDIGLLKSQYSKKTAVFRKESSDFCNIFPNDREMHTIYVYVQTTQTVFPSIYNSPFPNNSEILNTFFGI